LDHRKTERRVATSKGVFEVPGFETRIRNAKVQRKRGGDYAAYYCLGRRDLLSFKVFNWPKKHTFSGVQTDMFALLDEWKLLAGLGMFLFGMFMMEQSMKLLSGRTFKVMTRRHASSRLLPMLGISGLGLVLLAQTSRCRLAGGGCVPRGAALDVF
jgi:hypothetical protein